MWVVALRAVDSKLLLPEVAGLAACESCKQEAKHIKTVEFHGLTIFQVFQPACSSRTARIARLDLWQARKFKRN